jgi:hypothetical protein
MRISAHRAIVALTATVLAAWYPSAGSAQAPSGKGDATAVLAAARQALGGEKKLTAVKTLTATGRTRQVRGDNLVPIEFEIVIELPDKYVRKDEIPAQETGVTAAGFNGDELVQDPPPPPAPTAMPAPPPGAPAMPAGAPRPNPSAMRVTALKQDFTRLALGLFGTSFPAYPLTFTYVAEAEAPQGKADVLEGKGPNNFTMRFFISRDTHLPLMVSWTPPAPPQRGAARGGQGAGGARSAGAPGAAAPGAGGVTAGAAPPAGAPPAGTPAPAGGPAAPTAPPENRLYFADYRDVDGMQLPFRLRRAVGADTIEETTFDRYKVNAKIDPKRFEVRK